MKPLAEQSHYEVLEIERDAAPEDVERAYRMAQATYAADSMATYSLLADDDVGRIRDRVELAYEVLSDAVARQRYDASLAGDGADPFPVEESLLLPLEPEPQPMPVPAEPSAPIPAEIEGFEQLDGGAETGPFDGARLRRARLLRGLEIDRIASITKINPTYLHFIEEDRFADLPAAVYVRGFVAAYARCIGLDPTNVALSYMERMQGERDEARAGRRWGR